MYECETCTRQFGSDGARAQHMNALSHWAERWECEVCEEEFSDEDEYDEHLDDYGHHTPQHECEACDCKFHTPQLARVHMDDYGHWRTYWCAICQRGFQNDNNLQIVRRSEYECQFECSDQQSTAQAWRPASRSLSSWV